MRKKKSNNKGFSLIELVIAIGLLAICILPALSSFISSARMNRDSRKLMTATEVAETIMEGFSDKDFEDIKRALGTGGIVSGDLQGNNAFCKILDDYYNKRSHSENLDFYGDPSCTVVSVNRARMQYKYGPNVYTIPTTNLISGDAATGIRCEDLNMDFYAHVLLDMYASRSASASQNLLFYSIDSSGTIANVCYGDIHTGPYRFDVIVSFIPVAHNDTDLYYDYYVYLAVYDHDDIRDAASCSSIMSKSLYIPPIMTMTSGMRAD